jgi:hypothetical protein
MAFGGFMMPGDKQEDSTTILEIDEYAQNKEKKSYGKQSLSKQKFISNPKSR